MTLTSSPDKIHRPALRVSEKGKLYLLVLATLSVSALSVLLTFLNLLYTRQITRKEFPTLVQTTSGQTIKVGFEDPAYRSPEVIQKFVADTLYYLMTMTSYGPGSAEASSLNPDRRKAAPVRVKVDNGQGSITQTAWLASEALEPNFADVFRQKLAQMTPEDVFSGREEIILKIDYIKVPEEIQDDKGQWLGKWQVDVIATLKVYRLEAGEVKTIPFNKRVTVRPLSQPNITNIEQFGDLAVALNASQLSGLQITDIKDLALVEPF